MSASQTTIMSAMNCHMFPPVDIPERTHFYQPEARQAKFTNDLTTFAGSDSLPTPGQRVRLLPGHADYQADVLEETRQNHAAGSEQPLDWEAAKKELRKRTE